MKLFFSLFLITNIIHARDLFILSGPPSQKKVIETLAKAMEIEEPFTQGLITIRVQEDCNIDKESLLQICITKSGEQTIVHSNGEILNRIFSEIKKEELSLESSEI